AHRELRAGAPADLPRGARALAEFRAVARATQGGAGTGAGCLPARATTAETLKATSRFDDIQGRANATQSIQETRPHRPAATPQAPEAAEEGTDRCRDIRGDPGRAGAGGPSPRSRRPRGSGGDRLEARREPAERADQRAGARHPQARGDEYPEL